MEEMSVTLRYDMNEKRVNVTLRVEPSWEYLREVDVIKLTNHFEYTENPGHETDHKGLEL